MKIKTSVIKEVLGKLGVFAEPNSSLISRRLVLLRNKDNRASLFATNTINAGRVWIDTDEPKEMEFCIEFNSFALASIMRGDEVEVEPFSDRKMDGDEVPKSGVEFTCGPARVCCVNQDSSQIAGISDKCVVPDTAPACQLKSSELQKAIKAAMFAKQKAGTPQDPWIGSVLFESDGSAVRMISTDRKLISAWRDPEPALEGMEVGVGSALIMDTAINSIMKFSPDETVSIHFGESVVMSSPSFESYTMPVKANFPSTVDSLFAHPSVASYEIDVKDTKDILQLFDNKEFKSLYLSFRENHIDFRSRYEENSCMVNDQLESVRNLGGDEDVVLTTDSFRKIINGISSKKLQLDLLKMPAGNLILKYSGDDGSYGLLSPRTRAGAAN